MLRTWHIAFRHHELMNPSSPEKMRALGARLRLGPDDVVLDLGCGTGGPAVLLARSFGCRVTAVDNHEPFLSQGRARAETAGVAHLIDFVAADGADFVKRVPPVDAALCIGAAWILGGFARTAATLREVVSEGGHVAIGDKYRRDEIPGWRPTDGLGLARQSEWPPLRELVSTLAAIGLAPVSVFTASDDDWETYHSLMWLSIEDWLAEHADHPDAERFADRSRRGEDLYEHSDGWAIVAGRRTSSRDSDIGQPRLTK